MKPTQTTLGDTELGDDAETDCAWKPYKSWWAASQSTSIAPVHFGIVEYGLNRPTCR